MRLTETQKRFREQMREIKQESSIYENPRKGNPFHKQTAFNVTTLVFVFIIGIFGVKYFGDKTVVVPGVLPVGHPQAIPQSRQTGSNGMPLVDTGAIPQKDSELIHQLYACQTELNTQWEEVAKFHRVAWDKRDRNAYRQALLNGISTCDALIVRLERLDGSGSFDEFLQNKRQLVLKSSLAFKYFLNYLNSNNKSDNDIANNYVKEMSEYANKDNKIFTSILDKHGYRYEVLENGSVRYWIRPN